MITKEQQEFIANSKATKRKEKIAEFFSDQAEFIDSLTIFGKLTLCILGGLLMMAALQFIYCISPIEPFKDGMISVFLIGYLFIICYMNFVLNKYFF